jgi:hypothetical protein
VIQEHAKEVAKKLGKSDFKASTGWSECYIKWHQIVFSEVCGESGDVGEETSKLGCQIAFNFGRIQTK